MRIAADIDEAFWRVIPTGFPTGDGQSREEWEQDFVSVLAEAAGESWEQENAWLAEAAAKRAVDAVHPEDTLTLLFWPGEGLATAIVHLRAGERRPGEEPIPLEELAQGGSAIDVYPTDNLGDGVVVRPYVTTDAGATVGAVYYLVQSESGHVLMFSEPTIPVMVSVMLEPFCLLVDTLRVDVEGAGTWSRAALDPDEIDRLAGEQWPALSR